MNKREIKDIQFVLTDENCLQKATEIANTLSVEVKLQLPETGFSGLYIRADDEGVSLRRGELSVKGDFSQMTKRLKKENLSGELLVKAAKIKSAHKPLTVFDATAGMGEDSLLLAAAGFNVLMFEYNKVIAELLKDAMTRALNPYDKDYNQTVANAVSRMTLVCGDSTLEMKKSSIIADIVYLDPMFPERQKSGLIKKKFQLLQMLEKPCSDEAEILNSAFALNPKRIVIKRPLKGAPLGGVTPSYTISGKSIRYDCITVNI